MKFLSLIFLFISLNSFGQNATEVQQTADFYVKKVLLGENVVIGEVKHTGLKGSVGQFQCDSSILGVSKGMALSTGKLSGIFQPNSTSEFTSYGYPLDRAPVKGDSDLDKISKGKSQDASIIEFDFVPTKNTIEFKYVFASEEYNEYVGSEFNDVFGFFLSGPSISGLENLAVLEDGSTPISVNTINLKLNSGSFRDNSYENHIANRPKKGVNLPDLYSKLEFDGLTKVLVAKHEVIPYQVYHLKIAIADVADEFLDSGVFLESTSFTSVAKPDEPHFADIALYDQNPPNIDSLLYGKDPEPVSDNYTKKLEDEKFRVTNVYFDFNSSVLDENSINQLEILALYLKKNQKKCSFVGYTDNVGSAAYNQKLSEERAKAAIELLMKEGIAKERLTWTGKSFANPIDSNATEEGRAQNRRVEIILSE